MAINCMRKVIGSIKAKKNKTCATFEGRSMTLNYPRDYRLIGVNQLSINTLSRTQANNLPSWRVPTTILEYR
ncbi:MAG: hypothetical protein ACFFCZ_09805 [Promethearchaeota archaeon]